MLTALQAMLGSCKSNHIIDELLPKLFKTYQGEFLTIIDGGAGIGDTTATYWDHLKNNLDHTLFDNVQVVCYEPLPENVTVLRSGFGSQRQFVIKDAALSNINGKASFVIPVEFTIKLAYGRQGHHTLVP